MLCRVLPSHFPVVKSLDAKVRTSVVLLISHVMATSYAKNGGENGLAAELPKPRSRLYVNTRLGVVDRSSKEASQD
jgi:hypothetical protein